MPSSKNPFELNRITKAVIPAAGLGTRLRPLTKAFPKELLPIGREPVLAHIVRELRLAGVTDALFIVSEKKPQIKSYFGERFDEPVLSPEGVEASPLRCSYLSQTEQRGLGDAILLAEKWTDSEPFVVAFGDCLIEAPVSSNPLKRMIETHLRNSAMATVLVEKVAIEKVSRYGILAPENEDFDGETMPFPAIDIVEKPSPETAPSQLAVAARWILNPEIFDALRNGKLDSRGELNLTDPVRSLLISGAKLWGVPLLEGEARRDIGNFESFYSTFLRQAFLDPEYGEATKRLAKNLLEER